MTSNLEQFNLNPYGSGAQAARSGQQNGQQLSELRRGTWLLQMERALLDANDLRAAPVPLEQTVHTPPAANAVSQAAPAARKDETASPDNGAVASLPTGTSQSVVVVAQTRSTQSVASTVQQAGNVTGSQASALSGAPSPASSQALTPSAQSFAPGSAVVADGGTVPAVTRAASAPIAPELERTALTLHGAGDDAALGLAALHPYQIGLAALTSQRETDPGGVRLNPVAVALRTVLPSNVLGLRLADADAGPEAAQESELPEPAAQPEQNVTEQDQYARRQLHLYQGADGVQAWIRDVDLSQARVQMIAQALGNELSGAGVKLKALTVNGKKFDSLSADDAGLETAGNGSANGLTDDVAAILAASYQ
jgi:hypothetical protein